MKLRSSWSSVGSAVLLALLLAWMAPPIMAQSQYISGTVVDASGGVVPGATVQITDAAKGGVARQTTTDNMGRFRAIDIEPGMYIIGVEKTGFKKTEVRVTLDVNTKLDVGNISMSVGAVAENVQVSAELTPMITTNTMDKSYVVDKMEISELPMNGRNFTSLMSTVPGMTSSAQSDFAVDFNDVSQFHSLGGRGSENNMYLDGSPNIDVGDNQSQYTQASVDAISEFRVLQSGFNAEYGRNSGMVIAVQTKIRRQPVPRHALRIFPQQRPGCQVRALQHAAAAVALQPVRRQFQRLGSGAEALDPAEQAAVLLLQPRNDAPQPARQRLCGCSRRHHSER